MICANHKFTHAYVRDRSDKEAWETSRAIPAELEVKPDFQGSIYGDESDPEFKKDARCHSAVSSPPTKTPAPPPTKSGEKGSTDE